MHKSIKTVHESKVFLTVDNEAKLRKSIEKHPFNQSLSITYPSNESSTSSFRDPEGFYRSKFLLSWLLEESLYPSLHNQELTGLSTSKVESEDSFCIFQGILTMNLTKDTYQRAGLEGKHAAMSKGKWIVSINFTSAEFHLTKAFKRLQVSFSVVFNQPVEFLITMKLREPLAFAHPLYGLEVDPTMTVFEEQHDIPNFDILRSIPNKSQDEALFQTFVETQEDILNHLALLALPRTLPGGLDPYITVYNCPQTSSVERITTMRTSGLLTPQYILDTLDSLKQSETWFVMHIKGFEHSPIAWAGSEHSFLLGGENCISVLGLANQNSQAKENIEATHAKAKSLLMWEVVGARDSHS